MAKKFKYEPPVFKHEGHAKPKTRRDFIAQGMITAPTIALVPSFVEVFASKAYGLDCSAAAGGGSQIPGFLCFDLAGGASIAGGNVMVGQRSGQEDYLPNYTTLGIPQSMNPANNEGQVNREFGLVFHSDSAMLRGLMDTTSATTRANIDGGVFCTSSSDDTGNNPHNPTHWINAAGANGELTALVGSNGNDSGGRSIAPANSINPAARPVRIAAPEDALSLVRLGKLADLLSADKAQKVLKAIESMSASQVKAFSEKDVPYQIKELVQCGYIKSTDMATKFTPERVNAREDADVNAVFTNLNNTEERRTATMAKLIADGFAGAGTSVLGSFDYHNGTRATGEARDYAAGRLMGQTLELAARKGRDMVVYAFSDGSVTSNGQTDGTGKPIWTADSGQRGAAFMLMYRAGGPVKIRDTRQIGAFKTSAAVDNNVNKLSSNVENLAIAVVANFLAIQGREGELAKIVGKDPFGGDLGQYLVFDKQG